MTREDVKKILAKLTILYPHFTVGEAVCGFKPTDVWYEMIGDMDYDRATKALAACARRCKFPPTIADIREEYDRIIEDEKKVEGQIRDFYNKARSYYPGSGEYGNGWDEFLELAGNDVSKAAWIYNTIVKYVNSFNEGQWLPDFKEAIKAVGNGNT